MKLLSNLSQKIISFYNTIKIWIINNFYTKHSYNKFDDDLTTI